MKKLSVLLSVFILLGSLLTPVYQTDALLASGSVVSDPINTGTNVWRNITKEVVEPIVLGIADQVLDKLTQDVISWANGDFEGDPGFINNWDEYLKNTKHETISGAFRAATTGATVAINLNNSVINQQYEDCLAESDASYQSEISFHQNQALEGNITQEQFEAELAQAEIDFDTQNLACTNILEGNAEQIAEQNYNIFQSGDITNARNTALAIATSGAKELNDNDQLDYLIDGAGRTLPKILGSESAATSFKNVDFLAGGFAGYLALADKHNTDIGFNELVDSSLSNRTIESVANTVAEQQTASLVTAKKRCTEYKKDAAGNRTDECAREIIGTPGEVVADKLTNALNIENDKALNLSGGLVSSLVGALGKLTDGLLDSGLNKLSNAATNALFNSSDAQNEFSSIDSTNGVVGNYQSQYDVLGVSANSSLAGELGTEGADGGGDIFNQNESNIFVGGPEEEDGTWNGGPRIIINLNESLDVNLKLAEEENSYFEQIDASLRSYKDTAIELDWCIPGPDYNWEERYRDSFAQEDDDYGYPQTKEMTEDPWVNIPGSLEMKDAFENLVDAAGSENARLRQRRDDVRTLVRTLNGIKVDIESSFSSLVTESEFGNLVLFNEDWNSLNQEQKIQALSVAENGFLNQNGINSSGYIILKPEEGETIESVVANEPGKAREAVKSMAWDLWRDRADAEIKQDLRYLFYLQEIRLSNQRFIGEAKANANRLERTGEEIKKLFNDCLTFKAYALGESVASLQDATAPGSGISQGVITGALYALNPYLGIANAVSNLFGGNGLFGPSGQEYSFIELDNARSNAEIKTFLEAQYVIFQDDNPSTESVFQTDTLIKPSSINNSILRFDDSNLIEVEVQITAGSDTQVPDYETQTLPETQAYFEQEYPDFGFKSLIQNSETIRSIYKYDRFYSGYNRARGFRGTLFCRNPNTFDAIDGTPDSIRSKCIMTDWYITKRVQYEELFSQFN